MKRAIAISVMALFLLSGLGCERRSPLSITVPDGYVVVIIMKDGSAVVAPLDGREVAFNRNKLETIKVIRQEDLYEGILKKEGSK